VAPACAAIGIPQTCACRHGFPQAFAMDPFHAGWFNLGLLKLTCPLLVQDVDTLEDDGMIHQVQSSEKLQRDIQQAHILHAKTQKTPFRPSQKIVRSCFPPWGGPLIPTHFGEKTDVAISYFSAPHGYTLLNIEICQVVARLDAILMYTEIGPINSDNEFF
jgi:hypothetical protein